MIREIYKIKKNIISLNIAGSKIDSLNSSSIQKTGVRVFENGKVGISSGIGNVDVETLVKSAKTSAEKIGIKYNYTLPFNTNDSFENFSNVKKENVLELCKNILGVLNSKHKDYIFNGTFQHENICETIETNNNVNLFQNSSGFIGEILFKHSKSPSILDGFWNIYDYNFNQNVTLNYFSEYLTAFEKQTDIMPGKYPIVVDNLDQAYMFNFFKMELNGERYFTNSGILSNKLNQNIFHKDFTLEDRAIDEVDCRYKNFDHEGIVRKNKTLKLIDKGKFTNVIADAKTAKKFNYYQTGNGFKNYNSNAVTTFNSLKVAHNNKSLEEILNGRDAIYIALASGGDFTSTGEFASPVQLAFLMRDGKLIGRLPELTIRSHIYKMFGEDYLGTSKNRIMNSGNNYTVFEMNVNKGS